MLSDQLHILLSRDGGLRIRVALTSTSATEAVRRHGTSGSASRVLAEALTAAVLVPIEHAKMDRVSVQWTGRGPLGTALGEMRLKAGEGQLRAFVGERAPFVDDEGDGLMPPGRVVVMRQRPGGDHDLGQVALVPGRIDTNLEHLLATSDQVDTRVFAGAHVAEDGSVLAGGVLVQRLPDGPEPPPLDRKALLAALPTGTVESLLAAGLGDTELKTLETLPLGFACPCSLDRVLGGVLMLEAEEIAEHAAEGSLGIDCQFCAEHYELGREELEKLLEEKRAPREAR